MINRTPTVSLRCDNGFLDVVEKYVKNGRYTNTSEAIRELAKAGAKALELAEKLKDPKESQKFVNEMESIREKGKIFDWTKTLSGSQLRGIVDAISMERENRLKLL